MHHHVLQYWDGATDCVHVSLGQASSFCASGVGRARLARVIYWFKQRGDSTEKSSKVNLHPNPQDGADGGRSRLGHRPGKGGGAVVLGWGRVGGQPLSAGRCGCSRARQAWLPWRHFYSLSQILL
jgi:hypothetical protein